MSEEFNALTSKTVMNYPEICLNDISLNNEKDRDIEIDIAIKEFSNLRNFTMNHLPEV